MTASIASRSPSTTGGHVIVDAARRAGAHAVFAIHGVQIEPIFQACPDLSVELVDVRHESSAGFAAEAYARVSGGLGVAAVCPGPGFTNVLTSMANASCDRTAVLYVVGSNPEITQENKALQVGLDHVAVATPMVKWACRVHSIDHLSRIVAQAIRIATTAPKGPVLLDVPADVLSGEVSLPAAVVPLLPAAPSLEVIDACLDALASARRPALLVGDTPSDAARIALARLVHTTGVPCYSGYSVLGALADRDDLHGGTLFQFARLPEGNRPDVVLAIGVQPGFDTPGLRDGGAAWGTEIVHIDSDPAEIGRLGAVRLGAVADPDAAIMALAERCGLRPWSVPMTWRESVRAALHAGRARLNDLPATDGSRLHPYAAGRVVADAAAAHDAVIIGDGAVCKHWLHDALQLPIGGKYLTHGRLGCMGMGPGFAMGASYATNRGPVVCVTGDGAMGFALGEFEAMVRHGLPIVMVVMNNARWAASQGFQMRPGGPQRVVGTTLSDANYHEVMQAFGGRGERVNTIDGLRDVMASALQSGTATCINVDVNTLGSPPEVEHLTR